MAAVQFKDYYQILGVDRGADEKAIRAAYRKLARKHHPDINPGDTAAEERFKEINEAHEVLSDASKRKMYDRFGEDWQRYRDAGYTGDEAGGMPRDGGAPFDFGTWYAGRETADQGGFRVEFGGADERGFSDFFYTLFGGAREARRGRSPFVSTKPPRQRGEDIEVEVEVTFEEAFRGSTRTFEIQAQETCPRCAGTGLVREAPCPTCDGIGAVSRPKLIEVRIPPGVATGSRIRVAGQGGPGIGGAPNGDAYIRVKVRPNPRFERTGDDLRTEVEVPLYTAVLGGEVVVPTPTGRVALTIPPETQSGRVFRLRNQGMSKLGGNGKERGDLLARVRVTVPKSLSEHERGLFEQLRELRPENAK